MSRDWTETRTLALLQSSQWRSISWPMQSSFGRASAIGLRNVGQVCRFSQT
jgi:hypothetical protein